MIELSLSDTIPMISEQEDLAIFMIQYNTIELISVYEMVNKRSKIYYNVLNTGMHRCVFTEFSTNRNIWEMIIFFTVN